MATRIRAGPIGTATSTVTSSDGVSSVRILAPNPAESARVKFPAKRVAGGAPITCYVSALRVWPGLRLRAGPSLWRGRGGPARLGGQGRLGGGDSERT